MRKAIILLLIPVALLSACMSHDLGHKVKGNDHVISQNKQVGNFTGVESGGNFDVYLTQGSTTSVKMEGEENILSHINMEVRNGVLNIDTEHGLWLESHKEVKIYITAPSYSSLSTSGAGNMTSQTKITNDSKLELSCSGDGGMKLEVDAPEITVGVSGAGDIELAGEAKKLNVDVSGAGHIKAYGLKTEESDLQLSGAGSIEVFCSVKLNATLSGIGEIHYKGNPEVTKNVSGMGEIGKVD